ncbi:MAG: MraY family glycosyltransferase [Desulfuromonas sp.]|nr:MraY family glycosyltransferase [Desulfuromonas sp.]
MHNIGVVMYLMHNFYIFITSFFLSLIMVPAIRKWAMDSGAIDFPGERRANNRAIARAGGVAIFIPFIFSVLVYVDIDRGVRGVLAGSLLIFFTGLIDDLYQLTARQKFAGQISGCLVAIMVGQLYLTDLGNLFALGDIILPLWAGGLFALFAMVGVINALNFIDGLDGLAGGLSVVALLAFFWLGLQERNMPVLAISAGLLGGLLGFLKFNSFPARIFMGDTGSLVIGFLLGCISIMLSQGEPGAVNAVVPLMILSVPIVDTLVVMLQRSLSGRSVLSADRAHLHHKIMQLGFSHSITVFLIYAISLLWALVALVFRDSPEYWLFFVFVVGSALLHWFVNLLLQRRMTFKLSDKPKITCTAGLSSFSYYADKAADLFIVAGMIFYVALATIESETSQVYPVFLIVVLIGFVACFTFWRLPDKINLFCVLSMLPIALINYYVEVWSDELANTGTLFASADNIVFLLLAFFVAIKFLLLKSIDSVLDIFFEFFLFAMALILAVVSSDLDATYYLSGVISKCIVAFLALKFLARKNKTKALLVGLIFNVSLSVIIVRTLLCS